ncbi:MAG: glycosyltransferase family 2 protein [Patescibacteria group bacterium]
MIRKPTVTIGIPAYNEEANITHLIQALLNQNTSNFRLVKILVVSDHSTDFTEQFVHVISDHRVKLMINKKRLGLNGSQNKILQNTSSDILVLFDADVLPKDSKCISDLITPLISDPLAGLASGKLYALRVMSSPISRILANAHEMKRRLFENLPRTNNIYLCAGRMRAFSRKFYSKLHWPKDVPEDAYSYLMALKHKFRFVYRPHAIVYFHPPTMLDDHIKQNNRFITGKVSLGKYFTDDLLRNEYKLPLLSLITMISSFIIKRPFSIPAYFCIMFYISTFKNLRQDNQSRYEISYTSKYIKPEYEKA